jgi:hypothetical protein
MIQYKIKRGVIMNDFLEIAALCVCAVAGLIFCFMGNRWRRPAAAIYGVALGFLLGYILLPSFFQSLNHTEVLLISAGAGIVFGLLFALWIYFGMFMIGFGGGALLCILIIKLFSLNLLLWYVYVPVIVICSAAGALALNVRRIFLSIFSALIGAALIALVVNQLVSGGAINVTGFFMNYNALLDAFGSTVFLITLAVALIAGTVIQLAFTSRKKD